MAVANGALVVDDEFLIVELLSEMLQDMGISVCGTAATAEHAVQLARAHQPGLVLMDVRLKGATDGVDAVNAIRQFSQVPVIFITGSREPETARRMQADCAATILYKPILFDQLRSAVMRVMG